MESIHRALPAVVGGYFVHAVPPPVLKWVARARAGAQHLDDPNLVLRGISTAHSTAHEIQRLALQNPANTIAMIQIFAHPAVLLRDKPLAAT